MAGQQNQDWAQAHYTISGTELSVLKGQEMEIVFSVRTDAESFTEVWFDDLSLVVTQ